MTSKHSRYRVTADMIKSANGEVVRKGVQPTPIYISCDDKDFFQRAAERAQKFIDLKKCGINKNRINIDF